MFDDNWFTKGTGAKGFAERKKREIADRQFSAQTLREEAKKQAEEDEKKRKQEEQNRKSLAQKVKEGAGNVVGGVGNFVKDAAIDVKDTTVGAVKDLNTMVKSVQSTHEANKINDQVDARNKEWGRRFGRASEEKWKDPEFVKQAKAFSAETSKISQKATDILKADKIQELDPLKSAARVGETALNVGTLGIGAGVKQLGKQGVKQGAKLMTKQVAKQAFKTGGAEAVEMMIKEGGEQAAKKLAQEALEAGGKTVAKSTARKVAGEAGKDAAIGTAYGFTQTAKNADEDTDFDDYLINMAFGAGIGAAIPVVGAGVKKGVGAIKNRKAGVAQSAAEEASSKLSGATDDVNKMINQAIEEQSEKYGVGAVTRMKNWIGDQVNPFRAGAKIDDAYAKANGIKRSQLNAEDSIEDLMRRSAVSEREAAGLFEVKTRTGDSAKDLVKKYKGDSELGKEFNNYTNAKFDLEFRAKNKGKRIQNTLEDEQLQKFVDDFETRNPEALKDLETKKAINDMAVDYLEKSKVISKQEADQIKGAYKNAVPLERIFPDDIARPEVTGRNVGSIAKQTVIQRLEGGSDIPLSNSFDTMLNRVYKAVNQGNRAKVAQKIAERADFIPGANMVVTAGNKEARRELRETSRLVSKGVRTLDNKIKMNNRQVKQLEKELRDLNIEGVNAALSKAAPEAPKQPVKTITVKTVKEHVKDNAPKKLDDLKQSYKVKAMLQKHYGSGSNAVDQMAADIYNGGWTQLRALNPDMPLSTAKSIADQIMKKPTIKGATTTVTEKTVGRAPSQRKVIEAMFATDPVELQRIRNKIATREPKLAAKLDEVANYRQQIDSLKGVKQDLKDVAAEFVDDPTTGKQVISGVVDGQTFKMEIPPDVAKSIMGLDQQKLPSVLKAFAIAKKPFEVTWTGILNPVFSGVSFAFYDTPMSIINSPQGFRTLGPKAVVESFKSLKASSEFQKRLAAEGARPYGGSGASAFVKPDAKSLAAQGNILKELKYASSRPEVALSKLDVWGGKLANMTRTRVAKAAYDDALRKAKKEGLDTASEAVQKRAMENATLAYRTVMPDFDTMSNLTRQINAVVPFYAASVAGTRSFGQALKRDPVGTSAKALALGIAPITGVTAFSLMQPQGQEFYRDMEESGKKYVLDNNMIVVLPGAKKDDKTGEWTGIIKVPLAPEFRALNQSAWRGVRGMMGKGDGPSASHVALSIFDTVTGGVRSSENPLVTTTRIMAGQNPQSGERLVPDYMSDLPREEQRYDSTSGAGSWVGDRFGVSPIQGDAALRQFGIVGRALTGGDGPVEATADTLSNKFTGAYGEKAQSAFYKAYTPASAKRTQVSKEVTSLIQQGNKAKAKRVAEEYNASLGKRFASFFNNYGDSEAYDEAWDERLESLFIKTTDAAFDARAKNKR